MIKNNKVINQVLLPKVLSLSLLIAFTFGTGAYVIPEKAKENKNIIINADLLLISMIALLTVFSGIDVYSDYEKYANFSKMVCHKYLKQELKSHPELEMFKKVLDNPQTMQDVAAVVFNSLRPSERKIVAQIILNTHQRLRDIRKYASGDTETSRTAKELINDARDEIIPVIQAHAAIHPEFINEVYSALASANNTFYVMSKNSVKQHTK